MSVTVTDTPIKAVLGSEAKTQCKPVKRKRLFSGGQEESRKCRQLGRDVRRDESSEGEYDS